MNDFSPEEKARLLELLSKEFELFRQMYELTEKQAMLLAADDAAAFDSSLDSRKELIEEINGLHQETDILMQSYISFAGSDKGGKIDVIEKAVAQRQDAIAQCVVLNEKNTSAAKGKAKDYVKRIDKLSQNRKSLELYTPDVPSKPELLTEAGLPIGLMSGMIFIYLSYTPGFPLLAETEVFGS